MKERNGVRLGQAVRDLDGGSLGRVTALFEDGFATRKGFPILFRRDYVVRYAEVRGVRDGEIVVSRSSRDLFDLDAGELPASWRIPVPPGFPDAATPPEAALLRADLARGAISAEGPPAPTVAPPAVEEEPPLTARQRGERAAVREEAAAAGDRP